MQFRVDDVSVSVIVVVDCNMGLLLGSSEGRRERHGQNLITPLNKCFRMRLHEKLRIGHLLRTEEENGKMITLCVHK